jgi:hypothetical protein
MAGRHLSNNKKGEIMQIPQPILDAVTQYHATYRHPRLAPLEVSGIYALFPDDPNAATAQYRWTTDQWPGHDHPGVYFIFGEGLQLLYIGRAALLGRRLHEYFKYVSGAGSGCRVVHTTWKSQPRFVSTIALENAFEAGAVEEYLIGILKPEENGRLFKQLGIGKDEL